MIDLFSLTSTTSTGGPSAATGSAAKLAEDFDDFLTLLTTQLQNQDPLDPMDSGEFTQQLVSFTGVEQQIQTNQNLENLGTLLSQDNLAKSSSYLGHNALISSAEGSHDGTTGINWHYQNRVDTEKLTLEVVNDAGSVIYSESGNTQFGLHEFNWPGIDAAGNPVPAGDYTLRINATDPDGQDVEAAIAVEEQITAVNTLAGQPIFSAGPNDVTQSEILQLIYGS